MAGLYLVGAWLVAQVAGTILPMFGAPDWVARTVVIPLAIGFIPALVFSWIYELTPAGLKRDSDVSAAEAFAPQTTRRMDRAIIVVLVPALCYFAVDKFVLTPVRVATSPAAVAATDEAGTAADAGKAQPPNPGLASGDTAATHVVGAIRNYTYDNLRDVSTRQKRFRTLLAMVEAENAR